MRARIKATGEIIEVQAISDYLNEYGQLVVEYKDYDGIIYPSFELDFYLEDNTRIPDYWTRLEHQYAGMAMQSLITKWSLEDELKLLATNAINIAHALVEKLKQKEESKRDIQGGTIIIREV